LLILASGAGGGYESRMLEFGHYEISVGINTYTPAVTAVEYFHRRAREVCVGPYVVESLRMSTAPQAGASSSATVINQNNQTSSDNGAGHAAGVALGLAAGSLIRSGRTDKEVYGQVRC
jgi:hypothetical protein